MSLTQHLADARSPVRAYLAGRFPHTGALRFADTDEPATLVATDDGPIEFTTNTLFAPSPARVLPTYEFKYPWALAGTAFDYRLRYQFEVGDPETFVAARGWTELVRRPMGVRASDSGWVDLVSALSDFTRRANPVQAVLSPSDEIYLARICGLLALYEQVFRMGGIANPRTWETPIAQLGLNAPLDRLLALVDDRLPTDVAEMNSLFRATLPALGRASVVIPNPSFARSRDLGGADADLIVDRFLIEVKTIKSAVLGRKFAWQLLGYLLADTEDTYEIESVGWYFARQGNIWSFPTGEFLRRLAGVEVDLAVVRAEFAEVCFTVRSHAGSARDTKVDSVVSRADASQQQPTAGLNYEAASILTRRVERELRFFPPARGSGRWHAPLSEVPWQHSVYTDLPAEAPACGSAAPLDLASTPRTPLIGEVQSATDENFCRRCLLYTASFYAKAFDPVEVPELADLPYYPPRSGAGKWHVRAAETGFFHDTSRPNAPSCSAPVELDLTAHPMRVPDSRNVRDADERLCRKCPRTPKDGAD